MNSTTLADPIQPMEAKPKDAARARVVSIDALRGFDMLWILGGDLFMTALGRMSANPVARTLGEQLEHVPWAGFHLYDLIFPMFVFIVGVSLVFSLGRILQQEGLRAAHVKIFRRFVLLFLLGLFYSGGVSQEWPNIRLLGVLNRIALCYLFAALVFCHFRVRGIAVICGALLAGYWAMLTFVPFPDVRPVNPNGELISPALTARSTAELNFASTNKLRGVFEPGLNVANYVDQKYLPGKKWDGTWDPEGLLSTLPAIGGCLIGVLVGLLIQGRGISEQRKVYALMAAGAAALVAGWLWHLQFPVIKKIWTSSFVLVASGYSMLLLGLFHYLTEVRHWQAWARAFIWIGANPITLYVLDSLIGFDKVARRFVGGDVKRFFDSTFAKGAGDLAIALGAVAVAILLARFLYQRKIFLRI